MRRYMVNVDGKDFDIIISTDDWIYDESAVPLDHLSKSGIFKLRLNTTTSRHIFKLFCCMNERLYISCSIYSGIFRYIIKNSL